MKVYEWFKDYLRVIKSTTILRPVTAQMLMSTKLNKESKKVLNDLVIEEDATQRF